MAVVNDIVVDSLDDDVIEATLRTLGHGRIVRGKADPDEPYLTEDGFLVVRVRDADPAVVARELQRRVWGLRVVGVYPRQPTTTKED